MQLRTCVALLTCELDEFRDFGLEFAFGRCSDHPDAAARGHLEQSLVAQGTECAEDGVCVDTQYSGKVSGGWEPLAGLGFTFGDRATDFGGDLLV